MGAFGMVQPANVQAVAVMEKHKMMIVPVLIPAKAIRIKNGTAIAVSVRMLKPAQRRRCLIQIPVSVNAD